MAVVFNDNVYLFELKVVETAAAGAALAQLKTKGYADKYRDPPRPVHLIGVEFSREARNVVAFAVETLTRNPSQDPTRGDGHARRAR